MILATTREELARGLREARGAGRTVGLVPTMGYLHPGHLSLVELVRERSDFLTASIFVNPLQFGPEEDLDRYPRDLERDLALLEPLGVDLVFHPPVKEMYPHGEPRITVDPGPGGKVLCGAFRPTHFRGVLTVVARLFGLLRPRVAAFGRKDFQQASLIRRMVRDLEMDVEVLMGDTVREEDGLAMSSRNRYLSPEERRGAPGLYRGLQAAGRAFEEGERQVEALLRTFRAEVERHPPLELQYRELVHPESLERVEEAAPGSVLAAAAFCGGTRLIDNLALGG